MENRDLCFEADSWRSSVRKFANYHRARIIDVASENFGAAVTPCQVESRGYYIDAADYRARAAVCSVHITSHPHSRYVKYLTEFQRGISNGAIDRSQRL